MIHANSYYRPFLLFFFLLALISCSDDDQVGGPSGPVLLDVTIDDYLLDFFGNTSVHRGYLFISDQDGKTIDVQPFTNNSSVQLRARDKNNVPEKFHFSVVEISNYDDFIDRYILTYLNVDAGDFTMDRFLALDTLDRVNSTIVVAGTGGIYDDEEFVQPDGGNIFPGGNVYSDPTKITFVKFDGRRGAYLSYRSVNDGKVRYHWDSDHVTGNIDTIESHTLPVIENPITLSFPQVQINRVKVFAKLQGAEEESHLLALKDDVGPSEVFYMPQPIVDEYRLFMDGHLSERKRFDIIYNLTALQDPTIWDINMELLEVSNSGISFSVDSEYTFFNSTFLWEAVDRRFTWAIVGERASDNDISLPEVPKVILDEYPTFRNPVQYESSSFTLYEPMINYSDHIQYNLDYANGYQHEFYKIDRVSIEK